MADLKPIEFYKGLATKNGGELLSKENVRCMKPAEWRCGNGHVFLKMPNSVQQGNWCNKCSRHPRRTIEDAHALAKERGLVFLDDVFLTTNDRYEWGCQKGHRWKTLYNVISDSGAGCPICVGVYPKTVADAIALGVERGIEFIDDHIVNIKTKHKWRCKNGHIWLACYDKVRDGRNCSQCLFSLNIKNVDDLKKLGQNMGGDCLSSEWKDSQASYEWTCKNNHIWKSRYNHITSGHWCPSCSNRHSKPELEIYERVKVAYLDALSGVTRILKNPRFELDIWIPHIRAAIEFDGPSHFKPIYGQKGLDKQIARDARKTNECKDLGIELIRIDYRDYAKTPDRVMEDVLKKLAKRAEIMV